MAFITTWYPNGVGWTYSGTLTGEELLNSNFEIFGDKRFDDIRYQIVDLTAVEKVEVTESHMRKVAHLDMAAARTNPRVKVAVVTNNSAGRGLTSAYNQYTDGKSPWVSETFTTLPEAEAWAKS